MFLFFQGLATKVYEATQYGESSSVRALARERSVAHSFHFIPIILLGIHLLMATVTIIKKLYSNTNIKIQFMRYM